MACVIMNIAHRNLSSPPPPSLSVIGTWDKEWKGTNTLLGASSLGVRGSGGKKGTEVRGGCGVGGGGSIENNKPISYAMMRKIAFYFF